MQITVTNLLLSYISIEKSFINFLGGRWVRFLFIFNRDARFQAIAGIPAFSYFGGKFQPEQYFEHMDCENYLETHSDFFLYCLHTYDSMYKDAMHTRVHTYSSDRATRNSCTRLLLLIPVQLCSLWIASAGNHL